MKKHLLLIIFGLLTNPAVFAQSLELMKKDGSALTEDTIHVVTSNDSTSISIPVYVKNNSTKAMDVKIKAYVKSLTSGSYASYCWGGNCFPIATSAPEAHATINASDTSKEFHGDLDPKKFVGTTELMFTFYNKSNSDDSASVTIFYEITTSTGFDIIHEIKESITAYPNPVQNTLFINYETQGYSNYNISVYDIVGKKIKNQSVNIMENTTEIDVVDFKPGIYIWTFEKDGIPIKSDKFIKK